jgi:hypothetical protein
VTATLILLDDDGSLLEDNDLDGKVDYFVSEKASHEAIESQGESLRDFCSIIRLYSQMRINSYTGP